MLNMSGSGHILVAEDDPTDAFFFQRAFRRAGIPVSLNFVRDGQEVIEYLEGMGPYADRAVFPEPQLLLLDLNMPRVNGFEVLRWIRKRPNWNHLQVVLFSGSEEPGDISRAYDLGANWYLVKPHSMEELTELIGRFKKHWLELGRDQPRAAA
jgi:CheY-like chemotaxis protein